MYNYIMTNDLGVPYKPYLALKRANEAYRTVMRWVAYGHHPQHGNITFDEREIESANAIGNHYRLIKSDTHGTTTLHTKTKSVPGFAVSKNEALTHKNPDMLFHFAAYDVKDASLSYNAAKGNTNIRTFRGKLSTATENLAEIALDLDCKHRKATREFNTEPGLATAARAGLSFIGTRLIAKPLTVIARMALAPIECNLSRRETKICDEFAIKVVPNINLRDVETYYGDVEMRRIFRERSQPRETFFPDLKNNRLIRAFEDNFCREKPTDEERLAYMRKQQEKCLLKPE